MSKELTPFDMLLKSMSGKTINVVEVTDEEHVPPDAMDEGVTIWFSDGTAMILYVNEEDSLELIPLRR